MSTNLFLDVMRFAAVAESMNYKSATRQDLMTLCIKLIDEEANKPDETLDMMRKYLESGSMEHLAEAVDGAIDLIYVCIFFLNQMHLDGQAHWDLVQEKNMAKFPGGKAIKNEYGKVQKPEGWTPPDHLPLLIEWNSKMRGEKYVGGLIRHEKEEDKPTARSE